MHRIISLYGLTVKVLLLSLVTAVFLPVLSCRAADKEAALYGDRTFVKKMEQELLTGGKEESKSGKTYYISPKGKDSGNGTKGKPFLTFAKALKGLKPGDTLYLRGGTYKEKLILGKNLKGSGSKYITIRSYPGEKAILSGKDKKAPTLISIEGASYLSLRGLELTSAKGQDSCGILVQSGSHHLILRDNKFHDIQVEQPEKENHCANGILLFGEDADKSIHDVLIYKNKLYDCQTGWAECIAVTANCRNINLVSNQIKNTGNIGIDISGNYGYCSDPAKDFPRNCLIYKNKVEECRSLYATSYGIYVDGGQVVEIWENQVKKCSGGIEIGAEEKPSKKAYSTSDILVKKNTLTGNLENGITIGGYEKKLGWVRNVRVEENICRENGLENAILTLAKCDTIKISKNTFINSSGNGAVVYSDFPGKYTKGIVFTDNTYYNGQSKNKTNFLYLGKEYTSFEMWKQVAGKHAGVYKK